MDDIGCLRTSLSTGRRTEFQKRTCVLAVLRKVLRFAGMNRLDGFNGCGLLGELAGIV